MRPKYLVPELPGLDHTICECCGRRYAGCPHYATHAYNIDPEHAERIKARYALASRFDDPGFEETAIDTLRRTAVGDGLSRSRAYTDEGFVPIRVPRKINGDLLANVTPSWDRTTPD